MRFVFPPADNHLISRPPTNRSAVTAERDEPRTDQRLGHIIRVLSTHPTLVISGTRLAEEIGTTRSEVWRLVEQLRSLGVEITGHQATGYQLAKVPDLPLPEVLEPALRNTIFARRVHHYFRIESTNTEAMQAAAAGAPEGSVFLAEEQTAGRGRGGHSWTSPPSTGIYCSVVLRPALSPGDALLLSLISGLAVAEAVRQVSGITPDLRWPNDLMIGDKKFCGILTEMNAEVTRVRHAVVGIGINVNQPEFPPDLAEIATSLLTEGKRECSRVELTAALLQSLDREYKALTSDPATARKQIFERFEHSSSYARGRHVTVDEDGGYEGITAGLDERGFLLVETFKGTKTVLSGTVRPK
ncbi:MAG TPA: biotin--[acetyl-CoA-carboxylase] ligase [Terriglobales bacterium]|nr:biotin--[acetyl-CoA-carboxylase] ligase [Terriglobales bacterium]